MTDTEDTDTEQRQLLALESDEITDLHVLLLRGLDASDNADELRESYDRFLVESGRGGRIADQPERVGDVIYEWITEEREDDD